jgi:hypothetical protein
MNRRQTHRPLLERLEDRTVPSGWTFPIGSTEYDTGYSVAVDSGGNVFVAGQFRATADFDPDRASTKTLTPDKGDGYLAKYSPDGSFLWARRFGDDDYDQSYHVTVDDAGNAFMSGTFKGTATFSGVGGNTTGLGAVSLNAGGKKSTLRTAGLVARFSADGSLAWAKQLNGGFTLTYARGLAVPADGSAVYVTGLFTGTLNVGTPQPVASGNDGFVAKLDGSSGNALWAKGFGGVESDQGVGIALGTDGSLYIRGYCRGVVTFGTQTTQPASNGTDWFITQMNGADGAFGWVRRGDVGGRSALILSGSIATYQDTNTEYVYDVGGATDSTSGSLEVYVTKRQAATGDEVWTQTFGSGGAPVIYGPAVDAAGNVYVTGSFQGTGNFDPGPGMTALTSSGGSYDLYVAKLNAAGGLVWAKRMGGTGSDEGLGIAVDPDFGTVYATGAFLGPAQFDTGTGTVTLEGGRTDRKLGQIRDAFVLKMVVSASPLRAAGGPASGTKVARLTDAQLPRILAAAIDRWTAAGLDAAALAKLRGAAVVIGDLGGESLGLAYAESNLIRIDDDAAGHGWFVDPTPWDDAEFATPGDQGEQHRMDLLTVLTHELGHLLGHDHTEDGVMEEALVAGNRRTPAASLGFDPVVLDQLFAAGPTLAELERWHRRPHS